MKKIYAFVTNEREDKSIADAVSAVFADYGGRVPLPKFRESVRRNLRQSADLVQIVGLEKTPLESIERQFKAKAYRVIDDTVYQTEPTNAKV